MALSTHLGSLVERKRLVPDRFKRIWSLVQCIADEPGLDRAELARRFSLSERQLQSDLAVIRSEIGLPLHRERGYRFAHQPDGASALTLADALTLCQLVRAAGQVPSISPDSIIALADKLPAAFPPPLQPLLRSALAPLKEGASSLTSDILLALAGALACHQTVRLRLAPTAGGGSPSAPTIEPEVLLPVAETWYLIGHCRERHRVLMISVDAIAEVSVEA